MNSCRGGATCVLDQGVSGEDVVALISGGGVATEVTASLQHMMLISAIAYNQLRPRVHRRANGIISR